MKLEGKISILINSEYTTIEIADSKANTRFVSVKLTPEQLSAALSRQMSTECELTVLGLDKVGKIHENKSFEFEIPEEMTNRKNRDDLHKLAQSLLSDGWIAENYFASQDSFFRRGDKQYARCTIRRYKSAQ
jgi:phosphoribosylformylglycinamidine (FGAM) synthase PurS component